MTDSIRITSPSAVPATIAALLGFIPEESLVVAPVAGARAPFARLDLGHEPAQVAKAFRPAAVHWSKVLVVLYTVDLGVALEQADLLPALLGDLEVDVVDVLHVKGDVITSLTSGKAWAIAGRSGVAELDARNVHASREAMAAEADTVDSAEGALALARAAYKAGNGARVLMFLDRAKALEPTAAQVSEVADLERSIGQAVDPNLIPNL